MANEWAGAWWAQSRGRAWAGHVTPVKMAQLAPWSRRLQSGIQGSSLCAVVSLQLLVELLLKTSACLKDRKASGFLSAAGQAFLKSLQSALGMGLSGNQRSISQIPPGHAPEILGQRGFTNTTTVVQNCKNIILHEILHHKSIPLE